MIITGCREENVHVVEMTTMHVHCFFLLTLLTNPFSRSISPLGTLDIHWAHSPGSLLYLFSLTEIIAELHEVKSSPFSLTEGKSLNLHFHYKANVQSASIQKY